jgi:hypothetical protein
MLLNAFHVAGLALSKTWLGRAAQNPPNGREKNGDSNSFSRSQPRTTIEAKGMGNAPPVKQCRWLLVIDHVRMASFSQITNNQY